MAVDAWTVGAMRVGARRVFWSGLSRLEDIGPEGLAGAASCCVVKGGRVHPVTALTLACFALKVRLVSQTERISR